MHAMFHVLRRRRFDYEGNTGSHTSSGRSPQGVPDAGTSTLSVSKNTGTSCEPRKHMIKGPAALNNRCIVCNKQYPTWLPLLKHMRRHDPVPTDPRYFEGSRLPNRNYQCIVCGKETSEKASLRDHYCTHATTSKFKCPACRRRFKSSYKFLQHYRHCHKSEKFTCGLCQYTCRHKLTLKRHLLRHAGHDGKETCEVCFKRIVSEHLPSHYLIHTGEKPFQCETCHKRFRSRHPFQCHVKKVHLGMKPAPCESQHCPVCGARTTRAHYEAHIRRHTDEPTDICSICSKRFYESSMYVRHMKRVHIREKTRKCPVCGKAFYGQNDVTQHVKVHLDEMPFKCTVCGKAFKWKHKIGDHMKTHSEERPFKCDLCGEAFKWKHNLANHVRAIHK
ncbi:gastrula zinc finger protein XlCGF57.1-like isoform X2 [Ornithodoros turicata]|uniref:gastrula zinc finger protein XlCGF57.1-like isoform X2 n=1 Tax=Ornithodoros turicata TaxID=34597 RepID=UPI0031393553